MIFKQNDTLILDCPITEESEYQTTQRTAKIFIMRVLDEIIIIDNAVGTSLKVKRGTWFKRLERIKRHRNAFKEFLAKTKATKTEIIGIDLR